MNQQDIMAQNEREAAEQYAKAMADLGAHADQRTDDPERHANLEYDANMAQQYLQTWRALPPEVRARQHIAGCPLVMRGYIGAAICFCPESL